MKQQTRISDAETKELQRYLLEILTAIDRVCREHGLRYYLIAGTMLGAVRHKGFIPWDDDADVALPRKDYETLLAHAREWLPAKFELVCNRTEPSYPYDFARIHNVETTYILRRSFNYVGGLPVDVFPLDGMAGPGIRRWWHYKRYAANVRWLYYAISDPYKHGRGLAAAFKLAFRKIFSATKLHRRIDALQREYDYDSSALVADHDNKPSRGILPKEVYGRPTPVMFEGVELMGVAQPDAYLRHCYGNYMEMPKGYPPQNFKYLDLHQPYKTYMK